VTTDPGSVPGRAFVTGGSGFTGARVITRLLAEGWQVDALARSAKAAETVRALGAEPRKGDLEVAGSLRTAIEATAADVVINVASLGFGHGPGIVADIEASGTRRAVFVSTTAIFTTLNASSKGPRTASEDAIRASTLDWTILRPTMIYGRPGDRNMERLLRSLRRWPIWPLPGGGHRLQQPVHVDDLAATIVAGATRPEAVRQEYNVPGLTAEPFRDLVATAASAIGRNTRLVSVPLGPPIRVLDVVERRLVKPPVTAEQLQRLDEDKSFDCGPAITDLGHDPRPFAEGIADEARLLGLAR